jgi:predicted dehydrogenase
MEKIAAAIIGLGRIASLLEDDARREKPCTHAGAISANGELRLAAGCDTDEERRRLFAERWGVPVYAAAEEMLTKHRPGLLVIATHPDSHYQYCRLAAAHGVPALVCEKPLADTLAGARKIAGLCGGGRGGGGIGIKIITNHERRYSADYVRAKAILDEEKLGRLLSVRAVLYMGKNKRLLDLLWHDGTHLADAIMFLSGGVLKHRRQWGDRLRLAGGAAWLEARLLAESGVTGKVKTPTPALIELGAGRDQRDPASIPVVIEIGAGRDHVVFEMEFSCERGRLRIGNGVFEVWESGESPYAEKFRSLKRTAETFEGATGYFANMMADAAACARDPSRQPESSAADGLRVIEYLNAVMPWRR